VSVREIPTSVGALEGSLDEETAYLATKLAALESLRGGFTTVCDAGTRMEPDVGVVAGGGGQQGNPVRPRHDLQRPATRRQHRGPTTS
jgi:cytosine/adenosine deaminase-related metal-dependent hydrolase